METALSFIGNLFSQMPHYRVLVALVGVQMAVCLMSVVVFIASFIHFDLWTRTIECMRRFLYRQLTAYKSEALLTEALIAEQKDMHLERHWVTTEDGYTLQLQRITHVSFVGQKPTRAILMQHGLMETSSIYVLHGKDSLAFRLARKGYDVWLGNNRTSLYGQMASRDANPQDNIVMHDKIDTAEFWNYSIDELIRHDFPTMAHYIRETTGVDRIDFVGQSQGAGQAMGALCDRPELKDLFNSMILLAPALFLKKNPTEILLQLLLNIPSHWFGIREFFVGISILQLTMPLFLIGNTGHSIMKLMGFIKRPLGGNHSWRTRARWFSGIPMGCTSVNNMLHWLQILRVGGPLQRFKSGECYRLEEMIQSWTEDQHRPNLLVMLGDRDCVVDSEMTREVFERSYSQQDTTLMTDEDEITTATKRGICKVYTANDYGHTDFIWCGVDSTGHLYDKIERFLLSNY